MNLSKAMDNSENWIAQDLTKSGLDTNNFCIESLKDNFELIDRLGFDRIGSNEIIKIGGYWIPYPNVPGCYRLKLKNEVITENGRIKYLSPKKDLGHGNHAYVLPIVDKLGKSYNPDNPIFLTEGEKKSAKATLEGFPCIGLPGVWNFKDSSNDFLPELNVYKWRDRKVYIVYDSDIAQKESIKLAEHRLAIELNKRGAKVFSIHLPNELNGEKNGLDDFLVRYGAEAFRKLIMDARPTLQNNRDVGVSPFTKLYPSALDEAAYCGLAGEVVKAIEPHSEADPVALLMNLLTAFGNVIGDGSYFMVGAVKHCLKLFAVFVGDSSKGRKGDSWPPVYVQFEAIDPEWAETRIQTGLSSGEGVIYHVRDEIYKKVPDKKTGLLNDVLVDEGVSDKRLLIIEGEFAQTLKVLSREANTLSPVIRNAWDTGKLQTLTKNSPTKATGAHISIIGHITKSELLRALNEIETGNGFANRFLWLCVRRSKCLAFGGDFTKVNLEYLTMKLQEAVDFAKQAGEIIWAEETKPVWAKIYPELSEGKPGIIGAVTNRAEAQVTRLACIYALLDCSKLIELSHLKAAIAVWSYTEASAHYIFQNKGGDPLARKILEALEDRPGGMTRTEISDLLKRNTSSERIDEALESLRVSGHAQMQPNETSGRPVERWIIARDINEINEINEKRVV